jgi:hypothetical protein
MGQETVTLTRAEIKKVLVVEKTLCSQYDYEFWFIRQNNFLTAISLKSDMAANVIPK